MSTFDNNGFIQGHINNWIETHRNEHETLFKCANQLNLECHDFLDGLNVDLGDNKKIISAVLLCRMMELYQSILIIAERGMTSSSKALQRVHLEAYFTLKAIHTDPSFIDEYFDQFHFQRKATMNRIVNSNSDGLKDIQSDISGKMIEEANQTVEGLKTRKISLEDIARRAKLHDVYVTAYAWLSGAVHSSIADLDSHVEADKETNEIKSFRYGPSDELTIKTIGLASSSMADALAVVSQLFGNDRQEQCDKIQQDISSLLKSNLNDRQT